MNVSRGFAVTVGVVCLLGGAFIGWVQRGESYADGELNRQTNAARTLAETYKARVAKEVKKAHVAAAVVARESRNLHLDTMEINASRAIRDSLERALPLLMSAKDTITAYYSLYRSAQQELARFHVAMDRALRVIEGQRLQITTWKQLADEAGPVIDSLTIALEAEHNARRCRILFIPCPSRQTALLVGAAGGLAVGFLAH
jgi:hypothetical protein